MRRFFALFMAICVTMVSIGFTAFADDDEIKTEITDAENEITEVENEISELEKEKTDKSKELVEANAELKSLKENIDVLQNSIDENSAILAEAQAQEENSFKKFSERLMLMYEQGSNAYIGLILGAENLSDMIRRLDVIIEISTHDREIYQGYKENKSTIETKQQELEGAKTELDSQTAVFEEKISTKNTELEAIVDELNARKAELSGLQSKIEDLNTSLSSMDYADQLFAEAEKYIGMPYVFGGSTPETSFDCSGFVCYATTHSGVYNLPRTTAQGIYNQCIKISASEAKRGDIIFFQGTYNAGETVTHVGFYAGDGKMLHCGSPIQYTSIQTSYWQAHFYAFGRLKK